MIVELQDPYLRGPHVSAWQRIVGLRGRDVDGVFGPGTEARVRAWQVLRGVEGDGVIGSLTRAAVVPGDFIKAYEGCSLHAYDDFQDVPLARRLIRRVGQEWRRLDGTPMRRFPTIGWGRRLWPGEWIETCTQAEADVWFDSFLKQHLRRDVEVYAPLGADAAQRCAMYSLGYNGGPGAIIKLAAAKFDSAWWCQHYITSNGKFEPGLDVRRAEEAGLFWSGDPSPSPLPLAALSTPYE